jgi:hypothetical protein
MWVRCDVCRLHARLKLAVPHEVDYGPHPRPEVLDCLPGLQLGRDSWLLSDEGNITTGKSFRLPWLRDEYAPAT